MNMGSTIGNRMPCSNINTKVWGLGSSVGIALYYCCLHFIAIYTTSRNAPLCIPSAIDTLIAWIEFTVECWCPITDMQKANPRKRRMESGTLFEFPANSRVDKSIHNTSRIAGGLKAWDEQSLVSFFCKTMPLGWLIIIVASLIVVSK